MSINSISAYAQLQSWHAKQKSLTDNQLGSWSDASTSSDYSSAFTSVSAGYYTSLATVSAQSALSRIQNNIIAATNDGSVDLNARSNMAKSNGAAILARLGYSSGASSSSSSGTYTAPTNSATGYGYVKSSAANISSLNALNLFA